MRRFLRLLIGLLGLGLLVVGPPLLLWTFKSAFLPDHVPDLREVAGWITDRDSGQVFLLVVAVAGLVAWLQLVVAVVLECVALARGVAAPRLPGFRWAQRLVAGVLFGLVVGTTAAEASQPAAPASIAAPQISGQSSHQLPEQAEPSPVGGYTVVPGDSLMSIAAEQLGDENRYEEIFALNQGRRQADGEALRSVGLIKPGWRLELPAEDRCVEIVVKEGDTLTAIAQTRLGSAARYVEIFELNRGRPLPGGRILNDPDRIHPGDVLRLPGAATPAHGGGAASGTAAVPAPVVSPGCGPEPAPPAARSPEPSSPLPERVPAPIPAPAPAEVAPDSVLPLVAVGLGGLLAAGILATFARHRMLVQRRRRPGQRIRRPPSTDLETALRKAEEPATAEALDVVLRSLARRAREEGTSLPTVRSAVVGSRGVVLYPQGYSEAFADSLDAEELDVVPAPYPALVTLGHDTRRDLVMVNLAEIGTIALDGTTEEVEPVLLAMAWELATSAWSESVPVTLVGFGRSTAAHNPDRFRHFTSVDEFSAADPARAGVILSTEPLDLEHECLAAVVATSTSVSGAWRLDVSGKSTSIDELGIEVEPQRLTVDQAEELIATLAAEANAEQVPAVESPDVPFVPQSATGPELRLLGPVGLHKVDPMKVEGKKINRLTELAAFLLLHPGATADEISRQLGTDTRPWSAATRQGYISRLRTWLGHDENGDLYLPNVEANGGGYRLSKSMNSDWHRFRQLAGSGLNHDASDRRARLEAALELVTGMPFSNIGPGRYAWNSWHQREMIDAIVDVAHALAEICQQDGDLPAARRAILRGLLAEPVSELLYRDLLRVEYRAGNLVAVKATAEKLADLAAALDVDLDEETAALVDTLVGPGEGRLTRDLRCTHPNTSR
ncbi:LysM peptidoglycan-binding domain-containing protein [Amycolatopsis sp. EV170708-02-1]|uniref:LysM peptidoglycan-binding domain-containing protein n=1 Tax=Amycolatopsis sp. EV170708-02-1 TaxID=2919322 RepID=UPI001F0B92E7|nr:LysM peptidoglycan-binding domain-containing protein [Amycolatopsis sp. EV170708-02-1]UMP06717.1 LysM peptidoglycan-binding domain-containing protein [Amycolatopsis sp. EV170708-02-1]